MGRAVGGEQEAAAVDQRDPRLQIADANLTELLPAVTTGLRNGELRALRRRHLDLTDLITV
ncbi:hypothetical protein [Myceligenerans xiligouense]|uniref:hypothetical protein n=1 Tax=Myceligenerans xiligouense TaxID=253184 RepID=UPI001477011E|nr:hypothetical protein [Myceligenerans xiligouense]